MFHTCRPEEAGGGPGRGEGRGCGGDGAEPAAEAGRGGLVEGRGAEASRRR